MLVLSKEEQLTADAINQLKAQSGSHSPSVFTLFDRIPSLQRKIDACFLSNPYATDLFLNYLQKDLIITHKLRDVLEFYPSQNRDLAENLSSHLQIDAKKIFMGNGATEIIQAVIHNFVKQTILVTLPTFSSYYEFIQPQVQIIYYHLEKSNNFNLNIENYIQVVKRENPDTVVLINPNNPTANYITLSEIEYLLEELKTVEHIIIDESFIHFAFEDRSYRFKSAASLVDFYDNLIVIKSMSKDFGIAGIRCGYALMNENKVSHLLKNGYLWNLSGLAQYFFSLYAQDDFIQAYEPIRIKYIKETQKFFSKLAKLKKIKVYPSRANFVLLELIDGSKAADFVAKMLIKHGIYLRTCTDKKGLTGEFIRVAAKKRSENSIIINSIQDVFS